MFATFCGVIWWVRCRASTSTCSNSWGCCIPMVAKAHTVFASSCALKKAILPSASAAHPRASKSSQAMSVQRLFAKAHKALEISCGLSSVERAAISAARLLKTAAFRFWTVANDQAIIERHCTLNSPSFRCSSRLATHRKTSSPAGRESLANAHTRLDSSNGWKSSILGAAILSITENNSTWWCRITAQDQAMTLVHCTAMSSSDLAALPTPPRLRTLLTMVPKSSWKIGSRFTRSSSSSPPADDSFATRWKAVTRLMPFM
mmetsp:Transcript_97505/g.314843  ORF Transcript_97505/g.314843 Transcript_97505/m.314843 type:complete len:261 (-) Transcript_97505:207-989(-)